MRKLSILLLALALCLVTAAALADVPIDEEHFPDPVFRDRLTGSPYDRNLDGVLSDDEIAKLSSISFNGVKDLTSLKGIEYFPDITGITVDGTSVTELDLSHNTKLTIAVIRNNLITSLDFSHCPDLDQIYAEHNQLTYLNVNGCTKLRSLEAENNALPSLDLSTNTAIEQLYINSNQLTTLKMTASYPKLFRLYVYQNQLTSLTLSKCPALTELLADGNQILRLDVSKCSALVNLVKKGERKEGGRYSWKTNRFYLEGSDHQFYIDPFTSVIAGKITSPAKEGYSVSKSGLMYACYFSTATVTGVADKNATKVTIPATVKIGSATYKVDAIQVNAFKGLKKLKTVTIGKNVKTIGKNAFNGCAKLKTITINTTKLTTKTVGANAFKGIYKKATFKVPKAKKSAYTTLVTKKGAPKTVKVK